jgi:O-antigen/teichoic acid export membrane protein
MKKPPRILNLLLGSLITSLGLTGIIFNTIVISNALQLVFSFPFLGLIGLFLASVGLCLGLLLILSTIVRIKD